MKTLQECKDEVAKKRHYNDWGHLMEYSKTRGGNWDYLFECLEEASELFSEQKHTTPVSDEEINKMVAKRFKDNDKFKNYTPFDKLLYREGLKNMRSRLQQPVGIEWPDDLEITKYFSYGYGGDPGSAIYGAKWMRKELKSRVKVVDLPEFWKWLEENQYFKWNYFYHSNPKTLEELLNKFNHRTGGNDR